MRRRNYLLVSGFIFLVVAGAHLTRLIFRCEITICDWHVPHWISIPGILLPGLLSAWAFSLASKDR